MTDLSPFASQLDLEEEMPPKPVFRRSPAQSAVLDEIGVVAHPRLRKARRIGLYTVLVLVLLLAALAGAAYWKASSLLDQLHSGAKGKVVAAAKSELNVAPKHDLGSELRARKMITTTTAAVLKKTQTILMIGSDRRWGETGGRSDTMMLIRVNPDLKTISILSIPRDLLVPIPGHGEDKVNAAFAYGGDRLLIATLRDYFGVTINHFIEINFHGFSDMVNALGGVYLPIDGRYYNHNVGTAATNFADIDLLPGYQKLNGTKALQFVRFRHFDSDFYRAARQQIFLREVERQVLAEKYSYSHMSSLIGAFARNTASDISSIGEIWQLIGAARSTPADRVVREVLPAQDLISGGVYYLQTTTPEKEAVLGRWFDPRSKIRQQNITNSILSRAPVRVSSSPSTSPPSSVRASSTDTQPADSSLRSDGGRGLALAKALHFPAPYCGPTEVPAGYWWGSQSPMRSYQLSGHPALAGWLTAGSGTSVLLMETTWTGAPILSTPTRSFRRGGRVYQVWYESGLIRQISWQMGPTVAWLTNTIRNDLSSSQMFALASSCQAVY